MNKSIKPVGTSGLVNALRRQIETLKYVNQLKTDGARISRTTSGAFIKPIVRSVSTPANFSVKKLYVNKVFYDFLECKETEDATEMIYVLKPFLLRRTGNSQQVNYYGRTVRYYYISGEKRSAVMEINYNGYKTDLYENQYIVPKYNTGNVIYCMKVEGIIIDRDYKTYSSPDIVVQGEPQIADPSLSDKTISYIDINLDGRTWASI